MRLDKNHKNLILEKGGKVYEAYALMHIFKESEAGSYDIDNKSQTLQQYFASILNQANLSDNAIKINPKINGKDYKFQLDKQSDGSWKFKNLHIKKRNKAIKELDKYTSHDIISLLGEHDVSFSRDRDNNLLVSIEIQDTRGNKHILGGDKLDLRSIHISNIYNMLNYLQDPKLDPHMLVAMATGSGKSITQALWFLILFLGDIPVFFAAPDLTCKGQLEDEFAATLPRSITSHIDSRNDKITDELPRWGIFTHHELLKDRFAKLKEIKNEQCFVVIDEQHDAMREEIYSKRVELLSKNNAFMFLSATPTKAAYKLANNQAVSNLSNQDKERLGISKAAKNRSGKPERLDKKLEKMKANFFEKIITKFVDSVEPERTSPANEYYDMLRRECHFRQKEEKFYTDINSRNFKSDEEKARFLLRWNYQTPCQKSLVLTSDHDIVVNLSMLSSGNGRYVYKNGNKVPRELVYRFFMLGNNVDAKYDEQYQNLLGKVACDNVSSYLKDNALSGYEGLVDFASPDEYNKYNVLHGTINSTLTFLTGYDEARLDYERFHDLGKLKDLVAEKVQNVTQDDIKNDLKKDGKFPESIINEISRAMFEVVKKLQTASDEEKRLIIDNWNMDRKLHNMFVANDTISRFIEKYKTIFVMSGLNNSNSKIKSNRPFFKLKESTIKLHSVTGINPEAPPHKLSSIEALADYIDQYVYEPEYCDDDVTDEVVAQMFKKGFVGSLITSEKVTGFNDKNLHNVALLLGSNQDHLNRPDKIVQAAGRNRGLNPARQPFFMLCVDDKAVMSFDPADLVKKDIFPDFYKAKEKSYKVLMREIGNRIADKMRIWLDHNMTPNGEIDHEVFSNQALDICLEEFERLYNENGHSFDKTRSDFKYILTDLYKELMRENINVRNGNALPRSALILAEIIHGVSQLIYTFASIVSYIELKRFRYTQKLTDNEQTYINIIENFAFSELVEVGTVLMIMKKELETKIGGGIADDLGLVIKQEKIDKLNKIFKDYIAPYLVNMIEGEEHQAAILKMMFENGSWIAKLDIFKKMSDILEKHTKEQHHENVEAFREELVKLLKSDKKISSYMRLHNVEINVESMLKTYNSIKDAQKELQDKKEAKMRLALGMEKDDKDFTKGMAEKLQKPLEELAISERKRMEELQLEIKAELKTKIEEIKARNQSSGFIGSIISTSRYLTGMAHRDVNMMFLDTIIPSVQKFLTEGEVLRKIFPKNGKFITEDAHIQILQEIQEKLEKSKDPEEMGELVKSLLLQLAPEKERKNLYILMKDFPYTTVHKNFNDHFHAQLFKTLYKIMDDNDKVEFERIVNKYNWGKAAMSIAEENQVGIDAVTQIAQSAITDEQDKEKALGILNRYIDEKQVAQDLGAQLFIGQFKNILLLLPAHYRQTIHKIIDIESLDIKSSIEKHHDVDIIQLSSDLPALFSFVINVIIDASPENKRDAIRQVLNPDLLKEAKEELAKISDDMKNFQAEEKKSDQDVNLEPTENPKLKLYKEYVDTNKANKFLHDMSASYLFEQKLLLKELKKIFNKLSDKDLTNILRVKACADPEKEAKEIRLFLKDMESMKTEDFFKTYGKIGEDLEIEKIPLVCITNKVIKIFEEITSSKCYFDRIDEKGDYSEAKVPELKKQDAGIQASKLWDITSTSSTNQIIILSKKAKFVKGTLEGLKKLGTIDEIHHSKRSRHMEDAAKHLVSSLERNLHNDTLYDKIIARIRDFFYNLFAIAVSVEHVAMRDAAKEVARELNAAKSFSVDEIENENNPHKNAVARTRHGWEERVASRRVGQEMEISRAQ